MNKLKNKMTVSVILLQPFLHFEIAAGWEGELVQCRVAS